MLFHPKLFQMFVTVYTTGNHFGSVRKETGSPPSSVMIWFTRPSFSIKETTMPAATTMEMK